MAGAGKSALSKISRNWSGDSCVAAAACANETGCSVRTGVADSPRLLATSSATAGAMNFPVALPVSLDRGRTRITGQV